MEKKYTSLSGIFLLVIWITFLTGCPGGSGPTIPDDDVIDDPQDGTNSAPTVAFTDWGFKVSGAGIAGINQNYTESGISHTRKMFTGVTDTAYKIFSFWIIDGVYNGTGWAIDTVQVENPASITDLTYNTPINTDSYPPETGWLDSSDGSDLPALAVMEVPIQGDFSTFGNTMTASYIFSDPDGDAEGSSKYQWYRYDNTTDPPDPALGGSGFLIPLAEGLSYTTTSADDLKYLRIRVIPNDEHDLDGTAVWSSASRQIGGS